MTEAPKASSPKSEFVQAANLVQGETLCLAGVEPCSPGQMFSLQIKSGKLTNDEAAAKLGLTAPEFNNFLQGKLPVEKPLAEKLGGVIGTSSDFWMNMQASYEFGQSERGQSLLKQAASVAPIMKIG